ncbi:MAG: energy transducer TonB [Bdellovibrionaceae bacterium]|jgi:TonB family protein|nr:energy transducer TonB [Pseudobdellovibrionaceae bacterium]
MKAATKNSEYFLWVTLCFSLLLHAFFFFLPTEKQQLKTGNNTPIEVIYPEANKGQFVTQTEIRELQNKIEKLKKKTHLLSKKYQRVKKQTKAAYTAEKTQNKGLSPKTKAQQKSQNQNTLTSQQKNVLLKKTENPSVKRSLGLSTIAEHIPGVEEGHFTVLDSDPYAYYGFHSRVSQQVVNRWVPKLHNIRRQLSRKSLVKLSQKPRTTIVEIVLDKEGYFQKANIIKSSEFDYLDQAAIEPFKEASPLLNPPEGMVDENDQVRFKVGFYLSWNPQKVILR